MDFLGTPLHGFSCLIPAKFSRPFPPHLTTKEPVRSGFPLASPSPFQARNQALGRQANQPMAPALGVQVMPPGACVRLGPWRPWLAGETEPIALRRRSFVVRCQRYHATWRAFACAADPSKTTRGRTNATRTSPRGLGPRLEGLADTAPAACGPPPGSPRRLTNLPWRLAECPRGRSPARDQGPKRSNCWEA